MQVEEIFEKVYRSAQACGYSVYVVGGYVRDKIMGLHSKDIDFVIEGDAMLFANRLKKDMHLRTLVRYPRFGTFMTRYYGHTLEFVNARSESYDKNSRNPVTSQASLQQDISRRDFTINTLAMHISPERMGEIVDLYQGQRHIEQKIIKTPLDPEQTFSDDPLRMLRAIRFAARLGFSIDEDTFSAIAKNAGRLAIVSQERITEEFSKIMLAKKPSTGLLLLENSGLMRYVMPDFSLTKGVEQKEKYHHKDVFYHTLEVVDNIARYSKKLELRLAALLHDIGKPRTKRFEPDAGWTFHGHEVVGMRMAGGILKKMRYSAERIAYVKKLVNLHLRPMALVNETVTDSAIRRLIFLAGDDIDDLMTLCRADITSKNPKKVRRYLNNYDLVVQKIEEVEERDRIRNFQPPVDGREIMELFNLQPGPRVGKVKKFIEEAILNGQVANDHASCMQYIKDNRDQLEL